MRTNKANKDKINNELLNRGDALIISEALGITKEHVNKIKRGAIGKRRSTIFETVVKALDKRAKQNEELVKYCNQLKVKAVMPQ